MALGTVADVVRLDANNRRLVAQGPQAHPRRPHAARASPRCSPPRGRDPRAASGFDFGFALGPRINAAGRLADMTLGIECLLTDDIGRAGELAQQLDAINRERRDVEAGMKEQAEALLESLLQRAREAEATLAALALYDPAFHEGVVGIVASRLKDRIHRPTFVFALGGDGLLKGSGRSIAGFHLRDALDLVSKRHDGLLKQFGGHAMAAGCTIEAERFDALRRRLAARRARMARPGAARAPASDRRAAAGRVVQRRHGARARCAGLGRRGSRRRSSAMRWRSFRSAWSAKST